MQLRHRRREITIEDWKERKTEEERKKEEKRERQRREGKGGSGEEPEKQRTEWPFEMDYCADPLSDLGAGV